MDGTASGASSEQAAALQKENCLFCHIVEGKVLSRKVYEDESVIAILDINPANAGHILLMPKEHYLFMPQVPETVIGRVFIIAKQLSHAAIRALRTDGTTIFVANGGIAGQRAPHFMVHIIPRLTGDGLALSVAENPVAAEVQEQVKKQLQAVLGATIGVAAPAATAAGSEPFVAEEEEKPKKARRERKEQAAETEEAREAGEGKAGASESGADLDTITNMLLGGKGGRNG
ncbi:HIT domain-containing protein [Candidatus Woesearchaeota archaeon]|nr:HIT domain-containing protein [Candidatus Woesearchaeota archaeon]